MAKRTVRRLFVAIVVVAGLWVVRLLTDRTVVVGSSGGLASGRGGTRGAPRPLPVSEGFQGCPADGDGGDRPLNRLKNRVDSATWMPTPFASVISLRWPQSVVRRTRADWTERDSITVAESEGLPVAVEGYLVGAKTEGPEATNCHGAESKFRDWHLWLAATPGKDRRRSIVVETTPIIRSRHPEWSLGDIHRLVRDSTPVRVSGWLMFDPEHPEQIGKTRGTLWEIHPIMRIEVQRDGRWVAFPDRFTTDYHRP
jgi:hypothetical protein